jgi:hypothetical protein
MPTVSSEQIEGFAFCLDVSCPGGRQERVPATRETTATTFRENGGDWEFTERSHARVNFVNDEDIPCPGCGKDREVVDQERPKYQRLTNSHPDALLRLRSDEGLL